jgi:SAM-dependent methyltransferase
MLPVATRQCDRSDYPAPRNTEMTEYRYVQYGCGRSAPKGWRNFDASPTLRFERFPLVGRCWTRNTSRFPKNVEYGDIVKGLPLSSNSCDGVYCSHILEHLARDDFATAMQNTRRILTSGAVFRLVLPDLEYSIKRYLGDSSNNAAHDFLRETSLGQETRARGIKGLVISWLGNARHLWMWDYKAIEPELRKVGFVDIRRAFFGDSTDPMFAEVEEKDRWDNCLGVECKTPELTRSRDIG